MRAAHASRRQKRLLLTATIAPEDGGALFDFEDRIADGGCGCGGRECAGQRRGEDAGERADADDDSPNLPAKWGLAAAHCSIRAHRQFIFNLLDEALCDGKLVHGRKPAGEKTEFACEVAHGVPKRIKG